MNYYVQLAIILFVYMNFWFIMALIKKRNDVADIAWGLGFVLIAWLAFILSATISFYVLLVNCLVTLWGGRLALHVWQRNKNRAEDPRYRQWRENWGKSFYWRSYFQVFILQGILLYVICLPVMALNLSSGFFVSNIWYYIGLLVWLIGFLFEVVGDYQLTKFLIKPENKGKIMQSGLWRITRHPNYFGEILLWWGIFIMTINLGYYWLVIGPLAITFLLVFISGVPLAEKSFIGRPDYEDYKKRTSVLFPWFPKKMS